VSTLQEGSRSKAAPLGNEFLDLARQGQNDWPRYLLSLAVILTFWLFVGSLAFLAFVGPQMGAYVNQHAGSGVPGGSEVEQFLAKVDPLATYLGLSATFVFLILGLLVAVKLIHQRPFLTLITARASFDWKRAGQGFAWWFGLSLVAAAVEALLYPGRYQLTFNFRSFFIFLPFVLILAPIQTTAEELLFRGYLMQGAGLLVRRWFLPAIFTSLLFGVLHGGNPELTTGGPLLLAVYFGSGLLAAMLTLRDNRLELALGYHAANNVFGALVANYAVSALTTPAVFTIMQNDVVFGLLSFAIMAVIFYVGMFRFDPGSAPPPVSPTPGPQPTAPIP
jgi:uncharacterized protein